MIHGFFSSVNEAIKFVKEHFPTYTPNFNKDWRTFDKWISPDEKAYVKIGVEILTEESKILQEKMKIRWKEMGKSERTWDPDIQFTVVQEHFE
jgi:hypothetical protein